MFGMIDIIIFFKKKSNNVIDVLKSLATII